MDSSGIPPVAGTNLATQGLPAAQVGNAVTSDAKRGPAVAKEDVAESLKPLRDPRSLAFQVEGNRIITTIIDPQNNTVVQQIPDAEVVRLAAAIDRLQGFFLSEKA